MTLSPREENKTNISPVDRLISNLDGTYYKVSEVAVLLNVSQNTLRRVMKEPEVKAPSYQYKRGQMVVYLYTAEDINELKAYFGSQGVEKRTSGTKDHGSV